MSLAEQRDAAGAGAGGEEGGGASAEEEEPAFEIGERSRSSRMVSAAIYLQRLQRCSRQSMETTAR